MSTVRTMLLGASLLIGSAIGLLTACERKWDFECTAVWTKRGKEVSREVYTYPQMDNENAATARCKEEMLATRPKGANAATCKCVGKE